MKRMFWMLAVVLFVTFSLPLSVKAASIYNNPNVTFSPDGQAWTTDAGETGYEALKRGYTVITGEEGSLRELETGEHYYLVKKKTGLLSIKRWEVRYASGHCIHGTERDDGAWHGLQYIQKSCLKDYKNGWIGTCADCGDEIHMLFYMDSDTAMSIKKIPLGLDYYYLCPYCTSLEQGAEITHYCRDISWNKYYVKYKENAIKVTGYVPESTFMYNNETVYEGKEITADTRLRKCTYYREGYEFVGWNTKADGTGESFAEEQEIFNLTDKYQMANIDEVTITLYAQWKKSESTLHVHPGGGQFDGQSGITSIKQKYGTTLDVSGSRLTPPMGALITFEENGGEEVEDIRGERYFKEWSKSYPFNGKLERDSYRFTGTDGSEDTITAIWGHLAITLPSTEKDGWAFGGWYRDEECTQLAGVAGDKIIIMQNSTLYAQWVSLQLTAVDDYTVFDGSGAVDLSWMSTDTTPKTYRIYQCQKGGPWKQIKEASAENITVQELFGASGEVRTYVVPYTGLYTLTATGAQGESYTSSSEAGENTMAGGKGGSVEATVFLLEGEVLTYNVGTTSGYNGGGSGEPYGNGGGMTGISSNKKGLLLVAGGGGGASVLLEGGPGGAETSLTSNSDGGSGGAGGGGGYLGGTAGEAIFHAHEEDCYFVEDIGRNVVTVTDISGEYTTDGSITSTSQVVANGYAAEGTFRITKGSYISTNNCSKMVITVCGGGWGDYRPGDRVEMTLKIYNQDEEIIFSMDSNSLAQDDEIPTTSGVFAATKTGKNMNPTVEASGVGVWGISFHEIEVDVSSATGIRYEVEHKIHTDTGNDTGNWVYTAVKQIDFVGHRKHLTCEYCDKEDGYVVAGTQAYGGSNYVNPSFCTLKSSEAGTGTGDGSVSINLEAIVCIDAQELLDVPAKDRAAPEEISNISRTAQGDSSVKVLWSDPADKGTLYRHRTDALELSRGEVICRSNITENTLISGVKGYYVLLDGSPGTEVNAGNGNYQEGNNLIVEVTDAEQYVHIATVDVAGNVSGTVHVPIDKKDPEVNWPIYTTQLQISCTQENIYAAGDKTWYVRADGVTSFEANFRAYMNQVASEDYQPNYTNFVVNAGEESQHYEIFTPSGALDAGEQEYVSRELEKRISGVELLTDAAYSKTVRTGDCRDLQIKQQFTISPEHDGKELQLIPIAGAGQGEAVVCSDYALDKQHGVTLIADGKAPEVYGTEILENLEEINLESANILISLSCNDAGSGVKEFYAEVRNLDSYDTRLFESNNGLIHFDIKPEVGSVFAGDFVITVHAVDNVGNDSMLEYASKGFTLQAEVVRMRYPQNSILQRGEYGILKIVTTGYVEKVVVEPMNPFIPDGAVFEYDSPSYQKEEELPFLVSLDASEGEYYFRVNAYKNGEMITQEPVIGVLELSGTILDDFRRQIIW